MAFLREMFRAIIHMLSRYFVGVADLCCRITFQFQHELARTETTDRGVSSDPFFMF